MEMLDKAAGFNPPKGNGPYPVTVSPRLDQKMD
jgi:hypothetical protein